MISWITGDGYLSALGGGLSFTKFNWLPSLIWLMRRGPEGKCVIGSLRLLVRNQLGLTSVWFDYALFCWCCSFIALWLMFFQRMAGWFGNILLLKTLSWFQTRRQREKLLFRWFISLKKNWTLVLKGTCSNYAARGPLTVWSGRAWLNGRRSSHIHRQPVTGAIWIWLTGGTSVFLVNKSI